MRILVCQSCYDKPQEQLRTVILPPDPVPIMNPRPEDYVIADNPLSALGFDPLNMYMPISQRGGNIGNMTLNAGVDAAFNGVINKRYEFCAALAISNSSFQNTVGKNWNADPSGVSATMPSTTAIQTHTASEVTVYAPSDRGFLNSGATGYLFQGSSDNSTWTTLSSGTTAGTIGETLSIIPTGATYQYHQFVLQGDGLNSVAVAQLVIDVADGPNSEI